MADEKTIYRMKTPSGDPVRVEEAWKDASGELLTEKVNKADAQTITGLKTFSTLPQSSATPSDDKDLATKKYSDDLWATRKAQEEKCYQALKTVTKDFTRTDPVYVRIGEDGEPEIHYTMTQANGNGYFEGMDLGYATLYVHNGKVLTSVNFFCNATIAKRIYIDSVGSSTYIGGVFSQSGIFDKNNLTEVGLFDTSRCTDSSAMFYWCNKLKTIPAYDFSSMQKLDGAFNDCYGIERFLPYGMKVSFNLSATALEHDAILEVFNNLGTVDKTAGITLTLGSAKLALMSDEEKAIATGKGWVLA